MAITVNPQQAIKVVVYTLLLINFGVYVAEEAAESIYTMRNGGSLLQWTSAFATTIDETAWITLILLLECETYLLSDAALAQPAVRRLLQGIRLVCYLSLAHTLYAYTHAYLDLLQVPAAGAAASLCDFVDEGLAFVRNLAYTPLTADNCSTLTEGGALFYTEPGLVLTDSAGLALERDLALVDIIEASVWLAILACIEVLVRWQEKGFTRGAAISLLRTAKIVLYGALWLIAGYWAWLGHWAYAWDEAVWIVGFFIIEMNLAEWRDDIEETQAASALQPAPAQAGQ